MHEDEVPDEAVELVEIISRVDDAELRTSILFGVARLIHALGQERPQKPWFPRETI